MKVHEEEEEEEEEEEGGEICTSISAADGKTHLGN